MDKSSLQHDVDMDTFSEDTSGFYAPPAHIAARFYSRSRAQRRSSAHSSRRSSVSSRHSRHSTLSTHGGPQSSHVAQHLRRASIIESRKARLADRAAHAEQVRLRAAIAKATPRTSYHEERALAAQIAREKLLAEITARCEEEVRRAKKIAEETKEKKAAEHARLKEEMAGKLAEAARRRSEYQQGLRRVRRTSLPAVGEKKINTAALRQLTQDAAAQVIQHRWRGFQINKFITPFLDLNVSISRVKAMEFEQVGEFLSEERVLQATSKLFKFLGLLEVNDQGPEDRGTARIFLSIFLVLGQPLGTLSHGGKEPGEKDLLAKAEELLLAFDNILLRFQKGSVWRWSDSAEKDKLSFLFNTYCSAFHSWKTKDSSTIIDIMISSFVQLDLIIQSVKNDERGGVADEYIQAIRQNQIQILARLKKFAGPEVALKRVRSAVRKARKQHASKAQAPSEQSIPRTSSVSEGPIELPDSTDVFVAPNQPSKPLNTAPEPTSFISRLGQTMTVLPSNREISHEIQINGTYEVQQQPWTESRKHFMDNLRSSMQQSMSHGGNEAAASWTHAMAILIRDKLLNLISRKHPLYDRIDGFLDVRLIDQTCRAGMFSYNDFFQTIAGFIAQICSPGRDEAVKAFVDDTKSDTIDRLFALINIIDLMTLDHINFAFRAVAGQVTEHGFEHERAAFDQDLRNGVHNLSAARRWWTAARSSLADSPSRTNPNNPSSSLQIQGNSIYVRGLVDLIASNKHLRFTSLPETLHLDWHRLLALRARSFKMVAIASILLTTKIRLRRNREAEWTSDAERLMQLDFADVESGRIVSVIERGHMMPESTKEGLLNFVGRVLPPAAAAAKNHDTAEKARVAALQNGKSVSPSSSSSPGSLELDPTDVFSEQISAHVLKSLHAHLFARLSATSTAEKVRVTTSAAEVLARAGMPEFVGEVGTVVGVLERVRAVDFRGHEAWYGEVAREVE